MKKQDSTQDKIIREEEYVSFLKKRLASDNYKVNSTPEEYSKTKAKYDKAKFKLKILKGL